MIEKNKVGIEKASDCILDWEPLGNRRVSRGTLYNRDVAINDRNTWAKACEYFCAS